jgi:hypothetical protein
MNRMVRWFLLAAVGLGIFLARGIEAVPAGDKKGPDKADWTGRAIKSRCSTNSTRMPW